MLLKEFPDINWLKKAIARDFDSKRSWDNRALPHSGWPSAILNVKTNHTDRRDIKGPFSLFINKTGLSQVRCDTKTVTISPDTYVVNNNGQHYDLLIDQPFQQVETYNIHFGEKLFIDTIHLLANEHIDLLDNIDSSSEELNIPIRSTFRDDSFSQLLAQVILNYENEEQEYSLHELLAYLLLRNQQHLKGMEKMSDLKSSTKEELIKRIYLGVDYIHAHYAETITLDQIATAAMLSKFHFLRVFKTIFGKSPHQYIKHIRIQKASDLLRQHRLPLNLVAQKVGIENGSSLSRMMFQLNGQRPSALITD